MKRLIMIFCQCLVCEMFIQAANDDGDNLYVYTRDAQNAVVYSLDNLDKLTFGNEAISIWSSGVKMDYKYKTISLITFREDIKPSTSIESLSLDAADIKITFERSSSLIRVESVRTLQGVYVYDLQGRLVTKDARKHSSYQISLLCNPQGVYVIRVCESGSPTIIRIVK